MTPHSSHRKNQRERDLDWKWLLANGPCVSCIPRKQSDTLSWPFCTYSKKGSAVRCHCVRRPPAGIDMEAVNLAVRKTHLIGPLNSVPPRTSLLPAKLGPSRIRTLKLQKTDAGLPNLNLKFRHFVAENTQQGVARQAIKTETLMIVRGR